MATAAVLTIHIDRIPAVIIRPRSIFLIFPLDITMVNMAILLARPCLLTASARNMLPNIRKTTGRENGRKASSASPNPRAIIAMGTMRAAIGRETGSRPSTAAVNTNSANAACPDSLSP